MVQIVFLKQILKTRSVNSNSVGGTFLCSCKILEVTININFVMKLQQILRQIAPEVIQEKIFLRYLFDSFFYLFIFSLMFTFDKRVKGSLQAARLDLYVNGEILSPNDDKRLISQVPLRDRTVSIPVFTK